MSVAGNQPVSYHRAVPATRDAAASRSRILRAAASEFTSRGFAGARVDEIARRARVNKALLYRYFGDKEELFKTVLEDKVTELLETERSSARLAELAGEIFDFYAANRDLVRLWQWEALDFGTNEVPNEAARAHRLGRHAALIREAQRSGHAVGSIDPRHTLASLLGLITFWFAFPQAARMLAGGDPYTPAALRKRRAHVVQLTRVILTKEP